MLKIRLKKLGSKKNPSYRIVVIDAAAKRDGRPIQELGHYNPKTKVMKLDKASALDWISKGAQPTETAQYLINNCNKDGSLKYVKKEKTKLSKKALAKKQAEDAAKAEKSAKTEEPANAEDAVKTEDTEKPEKADKKEPEDTPVETDTASADAAEVSTEA